MIENTGMNTCQRLAVRLHELGMITREKADESVEYTADWGEPDPSQRTEELTGVLEVCDVALQAHGEDVDVAEDAYVGILGDAERMIGGAVTVTDVELVGEIGSSRDLEFKVNGEPKSWRIEQESDDYLDLGAVGAGISDLVPGGDDPRVFHCVPGDGGCADDYYLLATPEQAAALRDEFDLPIEVRGTDGLPVHEQ
ncbi:hypothetical protein F4556_000428 [Kitasatospora gansuensis]|uniref:Uncharacterized protein n=1 Tax=Kitasatospora gansuensis TaxID=258050 RepID=A0A7W7WFF2_9ACTN|nr:hypothetical protein [Kitasatospora gansuensis]MBB4944893.1 hypothetical protein [Kitasatospora gansuensis]